MGTTGQKSRRATDFLNGGWPALKIEPHDARRLFADLANQALGILFETKGFKKLHDGQPTSSMVGAQEWAARTDIVQLPGIKGSRQLQGLSTKRQVHWHFGISTAFRSVPFYHARVKSRLIFSMDGKEVIASSARMHRLRRSSAKRWRNVSFERHANELPVLVR